MGASTQRTIFIKLRAAIREAYLTGDMHKVHTLTVAIKRTLTKVGGAA